MADIKDLMNEDEPIMSSNSNPTKTQVISTEPVEEEPGLSEETEFGQAMQRGETPLTYLGKKMAAEREIQEDAGNIEASEQVELPFVTKAAKVLRNTFSDIKQEYTFSDAVADQVTDGTSLGWALQQGFIKWNKNEVDPTFDPRNEPELLEFYTQGLSSFETEYLLDNYSKNRKMFMNASLLYKTRKERRERVSEYMSRQPLLGLGSALTAYSVFDPMNYIAPTAAITAVNGARSAYKSGKVMVNFYSKGKGFRDTISRGLEAGSRLMDVTGKVTRTPKQLAASFLATEMAVQGIDEVFRADYNDEDYDPVNLFQNVLAAGALQGSVYLIKNSGAYANVKSYLSKYMKPTGKLYSNPLIFDENDMTDIADNIRKTTDNDQAVIFGEALMQEKKDMIDDFLNYSNVEHKRLQEEISVIQRQKHLLKRRKEFDEDITPEMFKEKMDALKKSEKAAKETAKRYREKTIPSELNLIREGKHPKFKSQFRTKDSIEQLATDLEIDPELVNTPGKMRVFMGMDRPEFTAKVEVRGFNKSIDLLQKAADKGRANPAYDITTGLKPIVKTVENVEKLMGKIDDRLMTHKFSALLNHNFLNPESTVGSVITNVSSLRNAQGDMLRGMMELYAPSGMGRQFEDWNSIVETKARYVREFTSVLHVARNEFADTMIDLKTNGILLQKVKNNYVNLAIEEDEFEPILRDFFRLYNNPDQFIQTYGEEVYNASKKFHDQFVLQKKLVSDYSKMNKVEEFNPELTPEWYHINYDDMKLRDARTRGTNPDTGMPNKTYTPTDELREGISKSLESGLRKLGKTLPQDEFNKLVSNFAYGLVNKETADIENFGVRVLEAIEKLAVKAEGEGLTQASDFLNKSITEKLVQAEKLYMKELGNRMPLDLTVEFEFKGEMINMSHFHSNSFMEDQVQWMTRQAGRNAQAKFGFTNENMIDDALQAIADEAEQVADLNKVKDKTKFVDSRMEKIRSVVDSVRYGKTHSKYDAPISEGSSNVYKFLNKASNTIYIKTGPIKSIAETAFAIPYAGATHFFKEMMTTFLPSFKNLRLNKVEQLDELNKFILLFQGFGGEGYLNNVRGKYLKNKIYDSNGYEKAIDVTQNAFSRNIVPVEKSSRIMTTRVLMQSLHGHFSKTDRSDLINSVLTDSNFTNRSFEGLNLGVRKQINGKWVFTPNERYERLSKVFNELSLKNDKGHFIGLDMDKISIEDRDLFGEVITKLVDHTLASTDETTRKAFMSNPFFSIIFQFTSWARNASTKIAGRSYADALNSLNKGDYSDAKILGSKLFWGSALAYMVNGVLQLEKGEIDDFGQANNSRVPLMGVALRDNILLSDLFKVMDMGAYYGGYEGFELLANPYYGDPKTFLDISKSPIGKLGGKALDVAKYGAKSISGNDPDGNAHLKATKALLDLLNPAAKDIGLRHLHNMIVPNISNEK